MMIDQQSPDVERGFDWPCVAFGASVGVLAAFALRKALFRKNDDEYSRA